MLFLCGAATMFAQKPADKNKKQQPKQLSALDKYIQEASLPATANGQIPANGSLWSPAARFSDLASDLRARRVDDIVTIVVQESASAASTGTSKDVPDLQRSSQYSRLGRRHQEPLGRSRICSTSDPPKHWTARAPPAVKPP